MSLNNSIIEYENIYLNEDDDDTIIKIEECFIIQDGIIYKFFLNESENEIIIRHKKYEKKLNLNDFNSLTKARSRTIQESFNYLSKLFNENKINIKSININRTITLSFEVINIGPEIVELNLIYKENLCNSLLEEIYNKYNNLLINVKSIQKEIKKLKKDQKDLKIYNSENPKEIKYFQDIVSDSFAGFSYDDSFTVFRAINNILKLVYATKNRSIICYNLNEKSVSNKLFNCHNNYITNFRHYLDKKNQRDIILSISKKDNNAKLWDAYTWQNICNITKVNKSNFLYSSCFLNENNNSFIITSNGCNRQEYMNIHNFEPLKVYNFSGEKIKEINQSNDCTFFIDTYYDNKLSKIFIITGNYNYIKSYDYDKNGIYHKYYENNNGIHPSVIIKKNEEKIKLIESCEDGIIRIWGFHSADLLKKIKTDNDNLYGICLWNDNYVFVGCKDQTIKLIELKNGLLIKTYKGHNGRIISFKKVVMPNEGEYLFSQGFDHKIKLWINKKEQLYLN